MTDTFNTPKHKDLIYDVGMHKGEDTEFYLRKGFRVIAFEANPDLVRFCNERLRDYIVRGQLVIIEGAIQDPDAMEAGKKKITFYKNRDVSVWGTICAQRADRNVRLGTSYHTIEIDAVNFADVIKEHGIPHFMKTDIEGADMACIKVLKQFQERPDYISMESDIISFANIKREIETLADLGYDCFQAIEQSAVSFSQSPPYPPTEGKYVAQPAEIESSGLFGSELGAKWKSRHQILRQYRMIMLGYYFLGDYGIMRHWKFRGAGKLKTLVRIFLSLFTKASVPGWYDTHARHSSANASKVEPS